MFTISILLTSGLGLLAWFMALAIGDWALSMVFGKQILTYSHFFSAVLISTTISGLTMCGNAILIVLRKSTPLIGFSSIALGVCLILGAVLIQANGMSGAIWTLSLTYGVQFVLQLLYITNIFYKLKAGSPHVNAFGISEILP